MLNQRWIRSIGITIPVMTAVVLSGFFKDIADVSTNLFKTGITVGMVLFVANIILIILLVKNKI